MTTSPAGWYPQEDGRQRYWDGQQWTEHFAPDASAQQGVGPAPSTGAETPVKSRRWFQKKRVLIPAGILALAIFGSSLSDDDGTAPVSADPSPTASAQDVAAPAPSVSAPAKVAAAKPTTKAPAAKPAPKPAPPASQLGKTVRDGKFAFVVTSMKCGITTVGDNEYLQTKAQGQFCAVSLTVENIGDEPQSMFADNQEAFDSKDRKFSADSEASLYDGSSDVLWEEINPGNKVKGKVYFDIPKGAKLTKLELHDSMFSGGVSVRL